MEIIPGSRKRIVDKADMWLDVVIPSHTSGKRGKSREAVPTQAARQLFPGEAPCKGGSPDSWSSTASEVHPYWVLSPDTAHRVLSLTLWGALLSLFRG